MIVGKKRTEPDYNKWNDGCAGCYCDIIGWFTKNRVDFRQAGDHYFIENSSRDLGNHKNYKQKLEKAKEEVLGIINSEITGNLITRRGKKAAKHAKKLCMECPGTEIRISGYLIENGLVEQEIIFNV